MSMVMAMIRANVPLHQWRTFDGAGRTVRIQKEDSRKIAQSILSQCSHAELVELVSREFAQLPERIRIDFRTLASNSGACTGNVRKGVQRLNDKLGGQLLREENNRVFNRRMETATGASYRQVRVNEAIAGAKRKFGLL